jgi:signal transduction histidine kinase
MFDLDRMTKTSSRPVTYMGKVTVGREQIEPGKELRLPPGTHHVELRFNPIELVSPEKIRMQYRMDGVDTEWLDAKMPAVATYSNIPAGSHAFHMRSCNRDGVWDLNGTTYTVVQQPYFYETTLFRLAMAGLFVLALAAAYQIRVRQIAAGMNARFDERLAERTRIARDFHDTLLQTIQGSKMVADNALKESDNPERMKHAMDRLSTWLGQAMQEGRQALSSLRNSTTERNDLAEAIQRAGDECRFQRAVEFRLTLEGSGMEMHPIVRDEVYRIGYEAIRNACNHSEATALTVELSYLRDLVLRVRDNGRGFESGAAPEKKPGHYGLVGMYERAARISGKLTIASSPGGGTVVELVVPRRIVFPDSPGRLARLRRRWRRLVGD